ncbi:hypothetical protein [Haloferula sp. BvORR071]|uniref:hypothetical protein n=1 Tax=Haloferula sp. BvORR071 TaxID=1396141 RepID=UPI002240F181|nr:hypothetical protein [Haloferula sp. BvORR071]
MGIAEIMQEVRKLPDDQLLALAEQIDEEAARAVDLRFESMIESGAFNELATQALLEDRQQNTIPLNEVLDQRELP